MDLIKNNFLVLVPFVKFDVIFNQSLTHLSFLVPLFQMVISAIYKLFKRKMKKQSKFELRGATRKRKKNPTRSNKNRLRNNKHSKKGIRKENGKEIESKIK